MDDEKIIDLFFARSEDAILELEHKYGRVLHSLSFRILNDSQDAEECINDAYLGVWNAIPPARPRKLLAFVCRIVRNISIKRYKKNTAAKRNSHYDVAIEELDGCLVSPTSVEKEMEDRELTKIIEAFLDTLSREDRVIFIRRYWFFDTYSDIADSVGLTEKNVSVRLTRIRDKLRKYLLKKEVLL